MPRENSKCRQWQKQRRNRLKDAFDALAKVLPSYEPSINICQIEILRQATTAIHELQEEVKKIVKSSAGDQSPKDNIIRKLHDRIRRLLSRNEQLSNLLQDAGITIPKAIIKNFKRPYRWSNKISPKNAKLLAKCEMEKINLHQLMEEEVLTDRDIFWFQQDGAPAHNALFVGDYLNEQFPNQWIATYGPIRWPFVLQENITSIQNKGKHRKLKGSTVGTPKQLRKSDKIGRRHNTSKNATPSSCLFVLPQPVAVRTNLNQSCYLLPNPVPVCVSRIQPKSGVTQLKSIISTTYTPAIPQLGPGTLILKNGTVIPVISQPQVVQPNASGLLTNSLSSVPTINTNTSKNSIDLKIQKNISSRLSKLPLLKPNFCSTKTTQINKVPIPALTSKYANNQILLGNKTELQLDPGLRKVQILKSQKRKIDPKIKIKPKKANIETQTGQDIETVGSSNIRENPVLENGVNELHTSKSADVLAKVTPIPEDISSNQTKGLDIRNEIVIACETEKNDIEVSKSKLLNYKIPTNLQASETTDKSDSLVVDAAVSTSNAVGKNLDLNIPHPDFSNDIFASLQEGPGCQNPESTSPTAAFLLSFPLVSSIKASEVMDDENSRSQRCTPHLLQIGNIDTMRSNQVEGNLVNLDNFSLFSKDGQFYTSDGNLENNAVTGTTSLEESNILYMNSGNSTENSLVKQDNVITELSEKKQKPIKTCQQFPHQNNESNEPSFKQNEDIIIHHDILLKKNIGLSSDSCIDYSEQSTKTTDISSNTIRENVPKSIPTKVQSIESNCNVSEKDNSMINNAIRGKISKGKGLESMVNNKKIIDTSSSKLENVAQKDISISENGVEKVFTDVSNTKISDNDSCTVYENNQSGNNLSYGISTVTTGNNHINNVQPLGSEMSCAQTKEKIGQTVILNKNISLEWKLKSTCSTKIVNGFDEPENPRGNIVNLLENKNFTMLGENISYVVDKNMQQMNVKDNLGNQLNTEGGPNLQTTKINFENTNPETHVMNKNHKSIFDNAKISLTFNHNIVNTNTCTNSGLVSGNTTIQSFHTGNENTNDIYQTINNEVYHKSNTVISKETHIPFNHINQNDTNTKMVSNCKNSNITSKKINSHVHCQGGKSESVVSSADNTTIKVHNYNKTQDKHNSSRNTLSVSNIAHDSYCFRLKGIQANNKKQITSIENENDNTNTNHMTVNSHSITLKNPIRVEESTNRYMNAQKNKITNGNYLTHHGSISSTKDNTNINVNILHSAINSRTVANGGTVNTLANVVEKNKNNATNMLSNETSNSKNEISVDNDYKSNTNFNTSKTLINENTLKFTVENAIINDQTSDVICDNKNINFRKSGHNTFLNPNTISAPNNTNDNIHYNFYQQDSAYKEISDVSRTDNKDYIFNANLGKPFEQSLKLQGMPASYNPNLKNKQYTSMQNNNDKPEKSCKHTRHIPVSHYNPYERYLSTSHEVLPTQHIYNNNGGKINVPNINYMYQDNSSVQNIDHRFSNSITSSCSGAIMVTSKNHEQSKFPENVQFSNLGSQQQNNMKAIENIHYGLYNESLSTISQNLERIPTVNTNIKNDNKSQNIHYGVYQEKTKDNIQSVPNCYTNISNNSSYDFSNNNGPVSYLNENPKSTHISNSSKKSEDTQNNYGVLKTQVITENMSYAFSDKPTNIPKNTKEIKLPNQFLTQYNTFCEKPNVAKDASEKLANNSKAMIYHDYQDKKDNAAKVSDNKTADQYQKHLEQRSQCYFATPYSNVQTGNFTYTNEVPKINPTCSYMNLNKNYTNPLYSNSTNYNYSYHTDSSFNQNYYKPPTSRNEAKSYYSFNYDNYQDNKKTELNKYYENTTVCGKDKKNTDKAKTTTQNKPVNWMTTPESKIQTSDCLIPSFPIQTYSFPSTETDTNTIIGTKKPLDVTLMPEDKQFSWSPTKLPNFLDPAHNIITPTLPTLVGDLALGNPLPFTEQKFVKETKRKSGPLDSQTNFFSVSQLVEGKTEAGPSRVVSRRNSGNRSKNSGQIKNKRACKNDGNNGDKNNQPKTGNEYNVESNTTELFYEDKVSRSVNKNTSSYSAEALIGNQPNVASRKLSFPTTKPLGPSSFLTDNIVTYFPTADESYMAQGHNFQPSTFPPNFQNNVFSTNSFIYTAPTITSTYLSNTFEPTTHDYLSENFNPLHPINGKDAKGTNKNLKQASKEDKSNNFGKKTKKKQVAESSSGITGFDFPFLSVPGSTNSPALQDDFHTHTTFLTPTAPYPCKNTLYQKQSNEFNTNALLPMSALSRNNIQHPEVSPSMNSAGTLTNFNLSAIFPEINKGNTTNVYSDNRNKEHSNAIALQVPFNIEPKYSFSS